MYLLYEELQKYLEKSGINMYGMKKRMSKKPIGEYRSYLPYVFTFNFMNKSYMHKDYGDLRNRESMIKFLSGFEYNDEFLIFNYTQLSGNQMRGYILPKLFISGMRRETDVLMHFLGQAIEPTNSDNTDIPCLLSNIYIPSLLSNIYMVLQKDATVGKAFHETVDLYNWSQEYLNKLSEKEIILESPKYCIDKLISKIPNVKKLLAAADYEIPKSEQKVIELEEIAYRINNIVFNAGLLLEIKEDYVSINTYVKAF